MKLKKITLVFLTAFALLTLWALINSIDEAPHYDQSLLLPQTNIPDEQNGFAILRYLDKDYDKAVLLKDTEPKKLHEIISEWEWDKPFAIQLLSEHADVIEKVRQVITKPFFVIPVATGPYQAIPHGRLYKVGELVLLKSRLARNNGDIDGAIDAADLALHYCEKFKSDKNDGALSYFVASVCTIWVLDTYHEMVTNQSLTEEQFHKIITSISVIPEYKKDSFDHVVSGYFSYLKNIVDESSRKSIFTRWNEYTLYWLDGGKTLPQLYYEQSLLDKAYIYQSILFNKYYMHPNHFLNRLENPIRVFLENYNNFCDRDFGPTLEINENEFKETRLSDFFYPGSLENKLSYPELQKKLYSGYLIKRCIYYNYYSAIKTNLALQQYKRDTGKLPETLTVLIPQYMDVIPLDYFSGKPLLYSREKGWLYSVGLNHHDDGGSTEGFNKGRCFDNHTDSQCSNNPTFPINWNNYIFNEKLHLAEEGGAYDQNHLGWMYQYGHYTPIDTEKAIEWYSKAAAQNYARAQWQLGNVFRDISAPYHDEEKAFSWYKQAHEHGNINGSTDYADYLFYGKAGVTDFQQAARIFAELIRKNKTGYERGWLNTINWGIAGIDTAIVAAAWADYFLQSPDHRDEFSNDEQTGQAELHNRLGNYYRWSTAGSNTDEAQVDAFRLNSAYYHYQQAHDTSSMAEIDAQRKKPTEPIHSDNLSPFKDYACSMFARNNVDFQEFEHTQQRIFNHPQQTKKLISQFRNSLIKSYTQKKFGKDANATLDWNSEAMPMDSLLQLFFDFLNDNKWMPTLTYDDSIKKIPVRIIIHEQPAFITLNLLLASYGIGATCSDNTVHFFVDNSYKAKSHLFTTHFITQWDKVLLEKNQLSGNGNIYFEKTFSYSGDIINNLPNGKGKYNESNNSFIAGDNFVNGILYGNGERVEFGHSVEQGSYQGYMLDGYGEQGIGVGNCHVSKGSFKAGLQEGTGAITYYKCGKYINYWYLPVNNDLAPIWSFTGNFKAGKKTTGTCSIYKNKVVVDTFTCEFFEDSLVKIGDVSLLPPGMKSPEALRKYVP